MADATRTLNLKLPLARRGQNIHDDNDYFVCEIASQLLSVDRIAVAALFVAAVNSHAGLLAENKKLRGVIKELVSITKECGAIAIGAGMLLVPEGGAR